MTYVGLWARAFLVTLSVESLVALALFRLGYLAACVSWSRLLLAVVMAQLATHPIVWFVVPRLWLAHPWWLWLAECFAVVTEAVLYALVFSQASWRRLGFLSLAANLASWAVGAVASRW